MSIVVTLILISAFFLTLWNFFYKKRQNVYAFYLPTLGVYVTALLPVFLLTPGFTFAAVPLFLIIAAALFDLSALLLLGKAYECEFGIVLPLFLLSPIFIPMIAFFLIGESLSLVGIASILITVWVSRF